MQANATVDNQQQFPASCNHPIETETHKYMMPIRNWGASMLVGAATVAVVAAAPMAIDCFSIK